MEKTASYLKSAATVNLKKWLEKSEDLIEERDNAQAKRHINQVKKGLEKLTFDLSRAMKSDTLDIFKSSGVSLDKSDKGRLPLIELEFKLNGDTYDVYGYSPSRIELYKNNKDKKVLRGTDLLSELTNILSK